MSATPVERTCQVYKIECENGSRFVIDNAAELGNPFDHRPAKWDFHPLPVPVGVAAGEGFDTTQEAERAARASQPRVNEDPILV
jgi:hypothetical protein